MGEWLGIIRRFLTFAEGDAALTEIVGRQFDKDIVASQDPDVVLAHFTGDMSDYDVTIFELYPEHGVRQGLHDFALHFYMIFFRHACVIAS